jgi:hypothetical protein
MSEVFTGTVEVRDGAAGTTILLNGTSGDIVVSRPNGAAPQEILKFDASSSTMTVGAEGNEGDICVRDAQGRDAVRIDGGRGALFIGTDDKVGDLLVRDGAGHDVFHMAGERAILRIGADDNEGDIIVVDGEGRDAIALSGGATTLTGTNGP